MSTTIDSKVVEMRFDNKQFESNAKTTMSTLEKLKQSLNFDGAIKGFGSLKDAAKSVDMGPLGSAIETVTSKFSALEVIGLTALSRLTQKAVDAGVEFVKSLSVDNIAAGWEKFADKTTSVGTLISQGYDMDTVTEQLERLNWFTDETSYNFTDMVSNIAKFTASGQDLETSVTALEGIANWAALSGQNASKASQAMYQLSQAMGSGIMRKEDYKSIQNVSMDTDEFRQKALDAAVALGTLKKTGEDTYISLINANGEFSKSQFADHLTKDAWFTSDVMMSVFNDYSAAVDQIYEYAEAKGITASQAIEELGDSVDQFGLKAFRAAQEARTWADVVDSVKDAVSTSWMTTFELIFGNYEEAKTLWTDAANELYDVFMASSEARNEMLGGWRDLGGREIMLNAVTNAWEGLKNVLETVKVAFSEVFPPMTAANLYSFSVKLEQLTSKFLTFTTESEELGIILKDVFSIGKNVLQGFLNVAKMAKDVISDVFPAPSLERISSIIGKIRELTDRFKAFTELKTIELSDIIHFTNRGEEHTVEVFTKINETGEKLRKVLHGIASAFAFVKDIVVAVAKGFAPLLGYFSEMGGGLLNTVAGFDDFIIRLRESAEEMGLFEAITERIANTIKVIAEFIKDFVGNTLVSFEEGGKGVTGVVEVLFDKIADLVRLLFDLASAVTGIDFTETKNKIVGVIQTIRNFVVDHLGTAIEYIKSIPGTLAEAFEDLTGKSPAEVFEAIKEKVSGAYEKIKEVLGGFNSLDTSGLESLKEKFHPLETLFEGLRALFGGIWNFLKKLAPLFSGIASTLGQVFGKIGESLNGLFEGADFSNLKELVDSGILVAIGVGIKKLFDSFSDFTSNASKISKSVSQVFDSLNGSLKAFQTDLKADALLKIAGAVAILAAAVIALTLVDSDKLSGALVAMTAGFGELIASMKAMSTFLDSTTVSNLRKAATTMLLMSASILVLSLAMKSLSELDWDQTMRGIVSVGSMAAILVASAKLLSNSSKDLTKGSVGLIALAAAISMLVKPTKELGELDAETLKKGLLSVAALCAELVIFLRLANFDDVGVGTGLGLIALAEAVKILASAVGMFAEMDTSAMIQGLAGVGVVLGELAIFTKLTGDAKHVISTATGMVILGASMLIFAKAIKQMGDMSLAEIGKGLLTMGASLAIIAVAVNNMPAKTPIIAAGMVLVGAALRIIASAVSDFGQMSLIEIGKGILTLSASLAAIAITMKAMSASLSGAAAFLVVAGALAILVPSLQKLGDMSLAEIGKSLLALVGVFAVVGGAALLLAPVTPAILALGAAIALLGVGLAGVGVGLLAFSAGLAALAAGGSAGIAVLVLAIKSVIELIPEIITKVGEGLINLIQLIGESHMTIASTVVQIIMSVLTVLEENLPQIVEVILTLLDTLLTSLAEHMPTIVQAGLDILLALISGIADNIQDITEAAFDVLIGFLNGVAEKLPDVISSAGDVIVAFLEGIGNEYVKIVDAGFELIVKLIEGLASGVEAHSEDIAAAIRHLCTALLDAFLNFFGFKNGTAEKMKEQGKALIEGLKAGISSMIDSAKQTMQNLGSKILSGFQNFFSINSPSVVMEEQGNMLVQGLINGSNGESGVASQQMTELGRVMIEGFLKNQENFQNAGSTVIKALITGVDKQISTAKAKIVDLAKEMLRAFTDLKDKFEDAGANAIKSLILGVESQVNNARNKTRELGNAILNEFNSLTGQFKNIGANAAAGLASGLESGTSTVVNSSKKINRALINTVESDLQIHSPSRVFMRIGEMVDRGLANGIERFAHLISAAATEANESAIDPAESMIRQIPELFDDISDPVIRPILDLSNVSKGVSQMDSMINSGRSVDLAHQIGYRINDSAYQAAHEDDYAHESMTNAIQELRLDFTSVLDTLSKFKVVLDSGVLVGELAGPMDQALGRQAIYGGRGN